MKRKVAESRYPIVREIRLLSEAFERMRPAAMRGFDWLPGASEEIKSKIRATVSEWHRKCRTFQKQHICGVSYVAPVEKLLNLCGVEN